MLKRDTKMRCRVISASYLFIIYNLVSGSGAGARNTELSAAKSWITQLYIGLHTYAHSRYCL